MPPVANLIRLSIIVLFMSKATDFQCFYFVLRETVTIFGI